MGSKKIDSQVRILLTDTILALCKNTLNQYGEVAVEGLLGITLDKEEIFLVSLHETIRNKNRVSKLSEGSSRKHKQSEGSGASDGDSDSEGSRRKKRRKKNKRSRSTDSVSDGASKGSKSDGESYLRKSPHNSSSSQAVVKQEVIDDDDILITKENIRGKHDGHFSSYNQAGGDHLDLQMSQYQTGALSMSSNMASTGSNARYQSQLNVRFPLRGMGRPQQNRGMGPQQFVQPRRPQFGPGPANYMGRGAAYGQQSPMQLGNHGNQQQRAGSVQSPKGNITGRRQKQHPKFIPQATNKSDLVGPGEGEKQGSVRFSDTLTVIANQGNGGTQADTTLRTGKSSGVDMMDKMNGDDGVALSEVVNANMLGDGMTGDLGEFSEEVLEVTPIEHDGESCVGEDENAMSKEDLLDNVANGLLDDPDGDKTKDVDAASVDVARNTSVSSNFASTTRSVGENSSEIVEKMDLDPSSKVLTVGNYRSTFDFNSSAVRAPKAEASSVGDAVVEPFDLRTSNQNRILEQRTAQHQLEKPIKRTGSAWDQLITNKLSIDISTSYSCVLCGDSVTSVTNMGQHVRQAHGTECPPCCICGAQVKHFSSFKKHLLDHFKKDKDKELIATA